MLRELAQLYSDVLDPLFALPLFAFVVIAVAARRDGIGKRTIIEQVGVVTVAYIIGLLIAFAAFSQIQSPEPYVRDLGASLGAFIGLGGLALLWHRIGWTDDMVELIAFILVVTAVFAVVSPFWNMSGHVSLTAAPSFYMLKHGRRYVPFVLLPALMIPSRVLVNEHTALQAVTAFVVVSLLYTAFHYRGRAILTSIL